MKDAWIIAISYGGAAEVELHDASLIPVPLQERLISAYFAACSLWANVITEKDGSETEALLEKSQIAYNTTSGFPDGYTIVKVLSFDGIHECKADGTIVRSAWMPGDGEGAR
jgi:hypothetical protein